MNELLEAVAFEVGTLGVRAQMSFDRFPEVDGAVYVVIPHEYFATAAPSAHPSATQLRRTIAFCVEQPGTPWFDTTVAYARTAAAAVDINQLGARELRRRGIPAEHFQIGYTAAWDVWDGRDAPRPVDVVHLGSHAPRRLQALALYASDLWKHELRLFVPAVDRKTRGREDYVTGAAKWDLLARTKLVLNIHRQPLAYFEWVRVVEAICNGCVVVSEGSRDAGPLVAGEHYVAGRLASLGMLTDDLLSDPLQLAAIREQAYGFLKSTLPMASSAARIVELAASVARGGRAVGTKRRQDAGAAVDRVRGVGGRLRLRLRLRPGAPAAAASPLEHLLLTELRSLRATQKRMALGQIGLARALQQLEGDGAHDAPHEIARSPTYDLAVPHVSVLVPLYNHAHEVMRALESVSRSSFDDVELVVLDDGSTDASQDVVIRFVESCPELPSLLLAHHGNRGLGAVRNALVSAARGQFVLPLDADNDLYPTAITKLVAALEADPDAFFAYPILEVHAREVPLGLLGYQPWDPERLRYGNYIDALSLLRRDTLLELGGYTEDLRLYGWEDYDLWCRAAAHGLRGVHVPQILARYANVGHSMISTTNIDDSEAFAVLHGLYPEVFLPRSSRRAARSL